MILHTSLRSPYARKAQIISQLKGIELECVEANAQGQSGYTGGVNPLGKIPALLIDDGNVLYDSPVVCEYLDSLSDPILPKSGPERWRQLRLQALGDGISDAIYNYRYETVRPKALHWGVQIERHEFAIRSGIAQLERDVAVLGDPWEFGNIAIICALDYADFRAGHLTWREFSPRLESWYERFKLTFEWKKTFAY